MDTIRLIYEDKNLIAINKPAGISVHPTSRSLSQSQAKTLVDWLIEKYPEIKNVGDDVSLRPGIVHRLDKDASGVLLVARNQKSFIYLKKLFQERKIKKKYIVLLEGILEGKIGKKFLINLPIGKSKKDFRKKVAGQNAIGKIREAMTEYKILKKYKKYTLVEAWPLTGRTHQIRVHFKTVGHPVAGDKLYGKENKDLNRLFLHAASLEFTSPDGVFLKIEADLSEELKNFLNMLN